MLLLVWVAALLEGLSLTLIQGFLPLYVRHSLGEARFVTVGAVVAVPAFGTILASNFWGGLSDVSGRLKPFILVGLAGYVAALAGLPFLRAGWAVLVWVGLASLLYGTLAPSLKSYVTLARPYSREHALAYLLMSQSIGWFLGSFLGSRVLERSIGPGLRIALWIGAGLLAAHALVIATRLRDRGHIPAPAAAPARPWLSGLLADLASLYENRKLLGVCVLAFFLVAGNYIMWGFFTVFFVDHLHASVRMLGLALAASSLLGIVVLPFVGPLVRRFGGHWILAAGTSLYLVMYVGMALARSPVAAAFVFALPLYGMVNVSTNTLVSRYSPSSQRGGGLGVLNGTYASATIVGPLVGGLLADRFGLGVIPWISFGFVTVASVVAWRSVGVTPESYPETAGSASAGPGAGAHGARGGRPISGGSAELPGRNGD